MSNDLFRYFQTQQRALAMATLPSGDFEKQLRTLVLELQQQCAALDILGREYLCQELGLQLQRELIHAASARHRRVLLALLKKIERVKYQSPVR
ncbi:MAG: hypothetical protein ABL973_21000 [Micropepsaceae bacterium]